MGLVARIPKGFVLWPWERGHCVYASKSSARQVQIDFAPRYLGEICKNTLAWLVGDFARLSLTPSPPKDNPKVCLYSFEWLSEWLSKVTRSKAASKSRSEESWRIVHIIGGISVSNQSGNKRVQSQFELASSFRIDLTWFEIRLDSTRLESAAEFIITLVHLTRLAYSSIRKRCKSHKPQAANRKPQTKPQPQHNKLHH